MKRIASILFAILLIVTSAPRAMAAYTSVAVESFQGGSPVAGKNPTDFTTWFGGLLTVSSGQSAYKIRPGGYSLNSDTAPRQMLFNNLARYLPYSASPSAATFNYTGYENIITSNASFIASGGTYTPFFPIGSFFSFGIRANEATRLNATAQYSNPCKLFSFWDKYAETDGLTWSFNPATGFVTVTIRNWTDYSDTTATTNFSLYNQDCEFGVGVVGTEARWYYRKPGGSWTQLLARTGLGFPSAKDYGIIRIQDLSGSNSYCSFNGYISRMAVGTISAFTDVAEQGTWVDAVQTPKTWYVKAQTGDGLHDGTSSANAWSFSQLEDETYLATIRGTSTPWVYKGSGAAVASSIDVRDFYLGIVDGTIIPGGDTIYIDPEGSEIRSPNKRWVIAPGCEGVNIRPWNAATFSVNFSQLVGNNWTNVTGNVWKTAGTHTYNMLWYNNNWSTPINGTTYGAVSSALASASVVSYAADGTYVYLAEPKGTNPNSNGISYEIASNDGAAQNFGIYGGVSQTGGGIDIGAASVSIYGSTPFTPIKTWKTSALHNSAYTDSPGSEYPFYYTISGLCFYNVSAGYGDKHNYGTAGQCIYPTGSAVVTLGNHFQHTPSSLMNYGGATSYVLYIDTSPTSSNYGFGAPIGGTTTNNQILDMTTCTVNAGVVGSTSGTNDSATSGNNGWYTHNQGTTTPLPLSQLILRNCTETSFGQSTNQPNCSTPWQLMGSTSLGTLTPYEGNASVTDTLIKQVTNVRKNGFGLGF